MRKFGTSVIGGACALLLLAGCSGGSSSDQPQSLAGFDTNTADFIAVASTPDGKTNVAVLSGSAADGKGAGELSLLGAKSDSRHVMLRATGVPNEVEVDLPLGESVTLTPDQDGGLSGKGTIADAQGKPVSVQLSGSWDPRQDESIPDSAKCHYLDEKTLLVGNPTGKLVDELDKNVDHVDLDLSPTEIANQWSDFDAVIVNAASKGAVASSTTRMFLQGSKWVIIMNPQNVSKKELQSLLPAVRQGIWNESWAVAIRAGDPGASWNQEYHTVPLRKSGTAKQTEPTADEISKFVSQIHNGGDACSKNAESSSESNSPQAGGAANQAQPVGSTQNQYQVLSGDANQGVRAEMVAAPAVYSGDDSVTERANAPLELPDNVYGFTMSEPVEDEHLLPGSQNMKADPACKPRKIVVRGSKDWAYGCPSETKQRQSAEVSGEDKIMVFLNASQPATRDRSSSRDSALEDANVNVKWIVLHQQNTLVNGSKIKGPRGEAIPMYKKAENGYLTEAAACNWFCDEHHLELWETSWLAARAATQVKLGKTPKGTANFVTMNEASYPLNTIKNSNSSKSLSGSWSVNAGGGTFAAVPIFNLGGSYSKSWSRDTSISVPNWEVNPNYQSNEVTISWDTNTTQEGKSATFDDYLNDKVRTFDTNKMNVTGLVANSAYAWQSVCMFGKVNVKVDRKVSFASVYTAMKEKEQSVWSYRPPERDVHSKVIDWDLQPIEYELNFDKPAVALYPKTIAGFRGITPDGQPMRYNVNGCAKKGTEYPMPDELKNEIERQEATAKAKEKAEKEAAEAKEKAEKEKAEKAEKEAAEARKKEAAKKERDACFELSDQDEMVACLEKNPKPKS